MFNEMFNFFLKSNIKARINLFLSLETPVSTCFCQSLTTYINLLMKRLQDMSKLFDKVQHRGINFKLQKNGTFGRLLNLGTDFLKNRKQRAVPNRKSSQRADLTAGAPQGLIRCSLLSLSVPGKMKNSIFEMSIVPQTLNIKNYRTASAKTISLVIIRKLLEYSFKNFS